MTRRFLYWAAACAVALSLFGISVTRFGTKTVYAQPQYSEVLKLMRAHQYQQAYAECERLIETAPQPINAYQRLTEIAHEAGLVNKAAAFFKRLPDGTPEQQALKHYGLAALYALKVSPSEADHRLIIEHSQLALSYSPNLMRPYTLMAAARIALKQEAELERYLETLLAQAPQNAITHIWLAYFRKQQGRYKEGLAIIDKALELDPSSLEASYEKISILWQLQDDSSKQSALTLSQQFLSRVERRGTITQQIRARIMLGYARTALGHGLQAVNEFRAGLQLAEEAGELALQETLLANLCRNYSALDDYANTVGACRQGMAISFSRNKEYYLGILGFAYRRLGDTPTGIAYYKDSLKVARQKNDQERQMWMLTNLGEAYVDADPPNYNESQRLLEEALQLSNKPRFLAQKSSALASLGRLYYEKGQYQKALDVQHEAYKLACAVPDKGQQARSLNSLGAAYSKLRQWQNALKSYQAAQQLGEQIFSARIVWLAHSGMAANYRQLGQFAEAEKHYRLAIQSQETTRNKLKEDGDKISFWQDKVKLYKDLISLLMRPTLQNQAVPKRAVLPKNDANAAAFQLAEQWRARALLDLMVESSTRSASGNLNNTVRHPIGLPETQRLLDDQTVMLSYSLDQNESLLFGVSHNQFEVYQLSGENDINECATNLLKTLSDKTQGSPDSYRLEANTLYRKLIAPAGNLLAGKKHLIIVPDGVLQRLPFEVLLKEPTKKTRVADPVDLPYLIKDFAISYAPSVSIWAQLREAVANNNKAPKDFIAFGNPLYPKETQGLFASLLGGAKLQPLNYSQGEMERIKALFGQDGSVTLYQGAQANEAAVKSVGLLKQYRYVHFSVHACANEAIPRFSGLLLSPPFNNGAETNSLNQGDGVLTTDEIMGLRLNAELVSLSACETGLGKQVRGEGLMGLMRAFIYAGTPSVAVSLWKVDERATADLMENFYKYLLHGKKKKDETQIRLNKAEALQQAQLDAIREGNAPYYWAPFVLVGHS
jgi:CHAT domain-containing protein/Tfp pilus assembly protein PilF